MKLGILGGMGPMATADFFKKVIELTDASKDQDHIHVLIDSNTEIPDRTNYIVNHGENPKNEMIRTATKLEVMGADVIAMPCNTAHYFYKDIDEYTGVPIINMIEETAKYVKHKLPGQSSFILLATTGTYESKVYESVFEKYGLKIIQPKDGLKNVVMDWIYQVKAGRIESSAKNIETLINTVSKGVSMPVILGCTELPVLMDMLAVKGVFVDSTRVLAKACVDYAKIDKNH